MTDSRAWTRPRFLLVLLLAALVAGAVPLRIPASRGDKASGAAAWRAASTRPASPRPDADFGGPAVLPATAPELLPIARIVRVDAPPPPLIAAPAPPFARSPLPRAPPAS